MFYLTVYTDGMAEWLSRFLYFCSEIMRPSAKTMESLKMVDYLMVLCAEKSIRQSKRVSNHSFSFYDGDQNVTIHHLDSVSFSLCSFFP